MKENWNNSTRSSNHKSLMKTAEVLNLKQSISEKGALTETLKSLKQASVEEKIICPLANI